MEIKPGTIMIAVPKDGAPERECFVCTGPQGRPGHEREMAKDAFLVGMAAGVLAMLTGKRERFCAKHETAFREHLAMTGCADPDTLRKLGIEFKVAGE
jgi:hypothetical protein